MKHNNYVQLSGHMQNKNSISPKFDATQSAGKSPKRPYGWYQWQ